MGEFLSKYGESIYNTRGGMYDAKWGGTTVTKKAIYIHILKIPSDKTIDLPPAAQKIVSSRYMRDNKKVAFIQSDAGIRLTNLTNTQNETDLIIKLAFE